MSGTSFSTVGGGNSTQARDTVPALEDFTGCPGGFHTLKEIHKNKIIG